MDNYQQNSCLSINNLRLLKLQPSEKRRQVASSVVMEVRHSQLYFVAML